MRYQILSNWLGVANGVGHMCYYLMDSTQKGYSLSYPETTGMKLVKWSCNGKEMYDLSKKMNAYEK